MYLVATAVEEAHLLVLRLMGIMVLALLAVLLLLVAGLVVVANLHPALLQQILLVQLQVVAQAERQITEAVLALMAVLVRLHLLTLLI